MDPEGNPLPPAVVEEATENTKPITQPVDIVDQGLHGPNAKDQAEVNAPKKQENPKSFRNRLRKVGNVLKKVPGFKKVGKTAYLGLQLIDDAAPLAAAVAGSLHGGTAIHAEAPQIVVPPAHPQGATEGKLNPDHITDIGPNVKSGSGTEPPPNPEKLTVVNTKTGEVIAQVQKSSIKAPKI